MQYQAELTKAMSRLRGIESMVNTVANAGTYLHVMFMGARHVAHLPVLLKTLYMCLFNCIHCC